MTESTLDWQCTVPRTLARLSILYGPQVVHLWWAGVGGGGGVGVGRGGEGSEGGGHKEADGFPGECLGKLQNPPAAL